MLKPEETAVNMFNEITKELINTNADNCMNRAAIVYFCTNRITAIKRALYDCSQLDDVILKKSINYWHDVQSVIFELNQPIKADDHS